MTAAERVKLAAQAAKLRGYSMMVGADDLLALLARCERLEAALLRIADDPLQVPRLQCQERFRSGDLCGRRASFRATMPGLEGHVIVCASCAEFYSSVQPFDPIRHALELCGNLRDQARAALGGAV